LLLAILAALGGCSGSTTTDSTTSKPSGEASTSTTGTTTDKPKPELPEELKHEGYAYFGLGNDKTMDVELRVKGRPVKTGGVTAHLESVENGKATYKIERTGAIAEDLGSDTVVLDKDGIYMTGSSIGTIEPAQSLQVPAKLSPGTKWHTKSKVKKADGQEIEEDSDYRVTGFEKVKTQVGEYDALVIESTGTASVNAMGNKEKAKYETKYYYVKDRGLVKAVLTMTFTGKAPDSVIIEESK
jgi:hypothetical protein